MDDRRLRRHEGADDVRALHYLAGLGTALTLYLSSLAANRERRPSFDRSAPDQILVKGRPAESIDFEGSAPEFGELLRAGSALVVTGLSSGRTQRQIHRIGAEHGLGVAVGEDSFDSAAA